MPSITFDDRQIPFEPGDTVIRAAHRVGVDVPHYCWHPGLSVAANCRMCLVELMPPPGRPAMMLDVLEWDAEQKAYVPQKKPKLQPACQLAAADGMVIRSQTSPHVARARATVQELLLLNHPVDCPICDQAGECRLQDYWLEHQGTKKRMHDEPVHKPKAVVFGPTIVYDAERCILCTRCVRFCEEVAKDPVLSVRERGNLGEIVVSPGRKLDHPYTLMTEYVCPVGALTAVDFRFKARVWFLRSAQSVCVGCATGCNSFTDFDPRSQKVQRYRPRENAAVNGHWMCDEGMLDYRRIHEGRVLSARVGGEGTTRELAFEKARELLEVAKPETSAVVLSAEHSLEDNFALLALAKDVLRTANVFMTGRPPGSGDDVLRDPDKNPNTAGVKRLAPEAKSFAEFSRMAGEGKLSLVVSLGSQAPDAAQAKILEKIPALVAFASHEGPFAEHAEVLLPASTWAEADGTFVNRKGIAQESDRAVQPHGESRPAYRIVLELLRALDRAPTWKKIEEIRTALAARASSRPPAAGEVTP
jgi:NADH-quinone oxidoreductase subunit G